MMEVLVFILVIAAIGTSGLGILFLSNATAGVGLIAIGCLCAILGRISQAAYHWANR